MSKALFEQNSDATLARVKVIYSSRGKEYGDTWRNCQHLCLRAAYRKLMGKELPLEFCTALAAAVMVDIKYQRNEGGYKDDTVLDGIAYQAFFAESMRKLT